MAHQINTPLKTPFNKQSVSLIVSLLPMALIDPIGNVKANLFSQLMRYDESFGGVVLTYTKISLSKNKNSGQVNGDEPHIHVKVNAVANVFAPSPGMILEGTVAKVSSTHLSLLAYGVFNATIAAHTHSLMNENQYTFNDDEWSSDATTVTTGSTVKFRVNHVQHADGILSMEGRLVSPNDEIEEDQSTLTPKKISKKSKKKTSKKRTLDSPDNTISDKNKKCDAEESIKKKKKKEKKAKL